ncbi:hypothetical protein RR11_1126 [Ruegeria sp. R11]|nr:hypothetical protein RR11_1126 [Ruegeria sp. R11]
MIWLWVSWGVLWVSGRAAAFGGILAENRVRFADFVAM